MFLAFLLSELKKHAWPIIKLQTGLDLQRIMLKQQNQILHDLTAYND